MSIEANIAHARFMDEDYTFVDCPGSIEFLQETLNALPAIDAAIVVCDPDADKAGTLKPILKQLDDSRIPHMIFVNKIDKASARSRPDLCPTEESESPLVLRQIPVMKGDAITGFIDLALERAYNYRLHQPSEQVKMTDDLATLRKRCALSDARTPRRSRRSPDGRASGRSRPRVAKKSSRGWRANFRKGSSCRFCSARQKTTTASRGS